MPYGRKRSYSRSSSRYGGRRRSYGVRRRTTRYQSRPRGATRRRSVRRSGREQVIRIVVEQPGSVQLASELLGKKVAPGPKKARF